MVMESTLKKCGAFVRRVPILPKSGDDLPVEGPAVGYALRLFQCSCRVRQIGAHCRQVFIDENLAVLVS